VADATFIVNKAQPVQMSDVKDPPEPSGSSALVYLKSVNYGRDYGLSLKSKTTASADLTSTAQTNNSTTGTQNNNNDAELKVSTIVNDLRTSLLSSSNANNPNGTNIEQTHNVPAADDFSYGPFNAPIPSSIRRFTVPQSFINALTHTRIVVTMGGSVIPYDIDGSHGWWWYLGSNGTIEGIEIPESYIDTYSWNEDNSYNYQFVRPQITCTLLSANAVLDVVLSPASYGEEPYFVINSPDAGTFKDFSIVATDDDGGVNLKAFKGTAKSFTDLPNQCINNYRLGVVGDNQKKEDDFHVVFEGDAGSGFWRETVAAGLQNDFDLTTMPHTLRQNDNLSFTFGIGTKEEGNQWQSRKAGDDNTNPAPSFVGQKITDIFFHRNRLGVLAGENVIFSEASGYYNFWRTTVRTLLDSDPIDVAVSQNEVSELKAAVPIQDNLLLFSNLNQFTLSASQLLTPAEVTVDQSTKYECDLTAPPVGAGNSVFFATKSGGYAGVREFFTRDDTEIKDAIEITSHVPSYIQGGIRDIQASSNKDMLIVLSDTNKNECYVYKWYNSSQERLQSSWSKWAFHNGKVASGNLIPKNIASVAFNNADLFFTFEDGSYEKMELSEIVSPVLLDNQLTVVPTDATYTALPTNVAAHLTNRMVVITEEGINLGLAQDAANLNKILNSLNDSKTLIFGEPYTFKYQLSEQVFKPVQGDSTKLARFQLRKLAFNYSNTGTFKVTVDSVGRDPTVSTFTGRLLGQEDNILGTATVVPEGSFPVGIQSQADKTNITITNDTHLPSTFQSAEWEGFVTLRNQRL
jgi:hypothetical protein